MKQTTLPAPTRSRAAQPKSAPASAPVIKNAKTNSAAPLAEKTPRVAATSRPKPAAPVPAPSKAAAKSAKTNSGAVSTPPKAVDTPQLALSLDTPPRVKPSRTDAKPAAASASPTKPVKTTSSPPAKPKIIPVKNAKTNSTSGRKPATANHTVKVVNEPVLEGGALWKMSGKNGVAYIKDAALAGELLATEPKNLAKRAMAVYYDKKGKAFAWQVRFDTERWEEVLRRLG